MGKDIGEGDIQHRQASEWSIGATFDPIVKMGDLVREASTVNKYYAAVKLDVKNTFNMANWI